MTRIEAIIDGKFLSVCPVTEAVAWLKEKRGGKSKLTSLSHPDSASSQETVLAERDDPYIDFGLARYGTSEACKPVYERGDLGIKCTFLAHFPNGGYALSFQGFFFKLSATQPSEVNELCALVTNPTLADRIFEDCFEKKGAFASLSEENYQMVLASVADNRRLMTPYDETYFDGYSRFSYHQVFHQAWNLAARVPNTVDWANILYNLTYRCLPPLGFDPMPIFPRWHFEVKEGSDHKNSGFFLRSRLADVLEPNDILLKSTDPALRDSFYRRFRPEKYPHWDQFAKDVDNFLDAAVTNQNIWRKDEHRTILSHLCWDHPDPLSSMDKPNSYRGQDSRFRKEHPEWFADEA